MPTVRVASSVAGWLLVAAGVLGAVGGFGVWADAGAAVSYGATFDGPVVAAASLGGLVVGVLAVAGLARWWVCGIAVAFGLVAAAAVTHGYVEVGDLYGYRDAVSYGWGLVVATVAAVVHLVGAGLGIATRRPRDPGWPRPIPRTPPPVTAPGPPPDGSPPELPGSGFTRPAAAPPAPHAAPRAGHVISIAALVALVGVFGPWEQEPLLTDDSLTGGHGPAGVLVVVAVLAAAVCGQLIATGRGGLAPAIVTVCAAPPALFVAFLSYGRAEKLFIPVTIVDGIFTEAGWGIYLFAAAMLVVLVAGVRVLGYRAPVPVTVS